jgi:NAD(P)-dependent dehydrogenase (short-subunit alcohol dehydrogenase family)
VARTILVTGSTDGLGRRVAELLVERGDRVLAHGRDPAKVARVEGAVKRYLADLSSLAEVRRLAEEVKADHDRIDVSSTTPASSCLEPRAGRAPVRAFLSQPGSSPGSHAGR